MLKKIFLDIKNIFIPQSILSYNGGAMVAMKGKNCIAIAADKRFGIQLQTVSIDFPKIYEMGPHLFVGLPGLATDNQTVMEKLRFRFVTKLLQLNLH